MNKFLKLIISVSLPLLIGFLSSYIVPDFTEWYASLSKPPFNPPSWVFAPIWTILYILIGISFYLIWKDRSLKEIKSVSFIYFIHLGLNFLWSPLFFGLRNPDIAFVEFFFLLISVFYLIIKFHQLNKRAAYLLLPYILWLSFAGVLNFSIAILN
jgi:tryptophan-rich sensory protein